MTSYLFLILCQSPAFSPGKLPRSPSSDVRRPLPRWDDIPGLTSVSGNILEESRGGPGSSALILRRTRGFAGCFDRLARAPSHRYPGCQRGVSCTLAWPQAVYRVFTKNCVRTGRCCQAFRALLERWPGDTTRYCVTHRLLLRVWRNFTVRW